MSKRWLSSPRWHQSAKGNLYRRDQAVQILIFKKGSRWGIKVGENWGPKTFLDVNQAKSAALRALTIGF